MDNSMVGLCGWRECQGSLKQGWVPALPSSDVLKPSHGSFTHMPETGAHDTFLVMKPLHVASTQEPPSWPPRRNHYPNSCLLTTLQSPGPPCPMDTKLASKPPDRVNLQAVLGELWLILVADSWWNRGKSEASDTHQHCHIGRPPALTLRQPTLLLSVGDANKVTQRGSRPRGS